MACLPCKPLYVGRLRLWGALQEREGGGRWCRGERIGGGGQGAVLASRQSEKDRCVLPAQRLAHSAHPLRCASRMLHCACTHLLSRGGGGDSAGPMPTTPPPPPRCVCVCA